GNETVDRTERDAVDELLGEDFHARAPGAEASPTIRQPVKLYQGAARPATAATLHPRPLWAEAAGWGREGQEPKVPRVRYQPDHRTEMKMGRYLLLWLLGVPIPILLSGCSAGFIERRRRHLAGPMGWVFRSARAINEGAGGLRPPHYLLPPPMDLGDLIRIFAFALVFAAMALWEILAPRRALAVG